MKFFSKMKIMIFFLFLVFYQSFLKCLRRLLLRAPKVVPLSILRAPPWALEERHIYLLCTIRYPLYYWISVEMIDVSTIAFSIDNQKRQLSHFYRYQIGYCLLLCIWAHYHMRALQNGNNWNFFYQIWWHRIISRTRLLSTKGSIFGYHRQITGSLKKSVRSRATMS